MQASLMGEGNTASRHTDGLDIDRQLMICGGDYVGGDLIMYNEDCSKALQVNLKSNPLFFIQGFNMRLHL